MKKIEHKTGLQRTMSRFRESTIIWKNLWIFLRELRILKSGEFQKRFKQIQRVPADLQYLETFFFPCNSDEKATDLKAAGGKEILRGKFGYGNIETRPHHTALFVTGDGGFPQAAFEHPLLSKLVCQSLKNPAGDQIKRTRRPPKPRWIVRRY